MVIEPLFCDSSPIVKAFINNAVYIPAATIHINGMISLNINYLAFLPKSLMKSSRTLLATGISVPSFIMTIPVLS